MERLVAWTGLVLVTASLAVGCSEKQGTMTETTTTTPDGSTTVTQEHKVETSGENPPPPAQP